MSFENHVCWQTDRIYTVLNTDAEHVSTDVFLAVHTETPLTMLDARVVNRGGEMARWRMAPRDFLEQFLDPGRNHVQAVIQGESGSGKSHLIKWMALNIPERPDRRLLIVPKAGMSLRRIVELLIDLLPEVEQAEYRARLERTGAEAATKEQRRGRLLNRIAEAIKADMPREDALQEEEEWLLSELPAIFYDPHLRTILDRHGGVIDELVDHIFEAPQGYERRESQRLFQREDLPLEFHDINQMSRLAHNVLRALAADFQLVDLSLTIINRNLDRAIPQVLNLNGDELIALMLDVRRWLRKNGQHLVLLIEDFARLQGIDWAMLQALIEPGTAGNHLCEMRWAMAVTRGYYERIPDTVKTRVHFLIDMDLPTGGRDPVLGAAAIVAFAARYLNAARLPAHELQQWGENRLKSPDPAEVPNACSSCPFSGPCHAAFGTANGHGLYPFTSSALLNMAGRKDARLNERFNPRILIKEVMAVVLDHGRALKEGEFPSQQLLAVMGGMRLAPAVRDYLQRETRELFYRYHPLLELWSQHPGTVDELPEGVYRAFGLAPLQSSRRIAPDPQPSDPPPHRPPEERPPSALERDVAAIRKWGNGEVMREDTAQRLRDLIYEALETYLDWDAAELERIRFAQKATNAPFRSRNVVFADQPTLPQIGAGSVSLPIPLVSDDADDRLQSALALEGLLTHNQKGSWHVPEGASYLSSLAECLDRWSAYLLERFQRLAGGDDRWEPVAPAVELLVVGAAMGGRPAKLDAAQAEWLNVLFEPWAPLDETLGLEAQWRSLYRMLQPQQELLTGLVRAWASGSKGGKKGAFLDAGRIVPMLRRIRSDWTLTFVPPDLSRRADEYGKLASLYSRVRSDLPTAVRAEWERQTTWLTGVRHQVPDRAVWDDLLSALEEVRQAVQEHGIPYGQPARAALTETLPAAQRVQFSGLINALEALNADGGTVSALPRLGQRQISQAMVLVDRFLDVAGKFLTDVESNVGSLENSIEGQTLTLAQDQKRITESLDALVTALTVLGGSHAS